MNCIERVLLFLKNIWGDFISFIDRLFIAVVYCVLFVFCLSFLLSFIIYIVYLICFYILVIVNLIAMFVIFDFYNFTLNILIYKYIFF